MRIIAGAVGLMVAAGHLCARVESPVVSLDKPLPSEALALACPSSGASEPETPAPGAFLTANLPASESQSLWAALSEARREIGAAGDAADGALLRAHNPGQRLAVRFMPNAVSVAPSGTNAAWRASFALDGAAGQPAAVVCRGHAHGIRPRQPHRMVRQPGRGRRARLHPEDAPRRGGPPTCGCGWRSADSGPGSRTAATRPNWPTGRGTFSCGTPSSRRGTPTAGCWLRAWRSGTAPSSSSWPTPGRAIPSRSTRSSPRSRPGWGRM
jgi:hypothetical protein